MKHSSYHRAPLRFLPPDEQRRLEYKFGILNEPGDHRFETPRAMFINQWVDYKDSRIIDIGCNTGYFIFNALDHGAVHAVGYEGAKVTYDELKHYVDQAKEDIHVRNEYFSFLNFGENYDVAHLLNVVHHIGDDYGPNALSMHQAKDEMLKDVNNLSHFCFVLVFQMGFNWHGNVSTPLFPTGTKRELINFIQEGTQGCWDIKAIGIPKMESDRIIYCPLNDHNITRNNALGEFLNRPLFIMKSKNLSGHNCV